MNKISFSGNYYFIQDTTREAGSLGNHLTHGFTATENGKKLETYFSQDEKGSLFLSGQEKKDRDNLFRDLKKVYVHSTPGEIDQVLDDAFKQRALKIDTSKLKRWTDPPQEA